MLPSPGIPLGQISWERMILAVERVRERTFLTELLLELAGVPFAFIGDIAVASWVATVDKSAVRNTPEIVFLLRRSDLARAATEFCGFGFVQSQNEGNLFYLDRVQPKRSHALRVIFAREVNSPLYPAMAPDIDESKSIGPLRVLYLDALVGMELQADKNLNRLRLRDLADVGLIDASWVNRFPPELGARLQHILDTPGG